MGGLCDSVWVGQHRRAKRDNKLSGLGGLGEATNTNRANISSADQIKRVGQIGHVVCINRQDMSTEFSKLIGPDKPIGWVDSADQSS